MLTRNNLIRVRDNVFITLGAVVLRQALLIMGGMLLPAATMHGGRELVAVSLLVLAVVGYGLWRSYRAKLLELILAEDAPHAEVVRKVRK